MSSSFQLFHPTKFFNNFLNVLNILYSVNQKNSKFKFIYVFYMYLTILLIFRTTFREKKETTTVIMSVYQKLFKIAEDISI